MPVIEEIEKIFGRYAGNMIAGHPDLNQVSLLPSDIWQQMRENKMFGLCLPGTYGGHNASFRLLAGAASALVAYSGNTGVALSWLIHEIISCRLICRFGNTRQKNELLSDLADGEITASFAVSEPEIGAHPKYLQTEAVFKGDAWRLTGEKCYITNAPMADWFLVMAKTGNVDGKNAFTAFMIHKDTPGLTIHPPTELPFLRPCPHGSITLENCRANDRQIIGPRDSAYTEMAIPFRALEDVLMMSLVSGAILFEIGWIRDAAGPFEASPESKLLTELGQLKCQADAIQALAIYTADLIDKNEKDPKIVTLPLFLRTQTEAFQQRFKGLAANMPVGGLKLDQVPVIRDIDGLLGIGRHLAHTRMRKAGKNLLKPF